MHLCKYTPDQVVSRQYIRGKDFATPFHNSVPVNSTWPLFKESGVFRCHPAPKIREAVMILKLRLLGCACICSSKILKPLGGKSNLEEDNDILGSLF